MSRFYGSVNGSGKTAATRGGTKNSGLCAHARGWDVGAKVFMHVGDDDEDRVQVYLTGGSNGGASDVALGSFSRADLADDAPSYPDLTAQLEEALARIAQLQAEAAEPLRQVVVTLDECGSSVAMAPPDVDVRVVQLEDEFLTDSDTNLAECADCATAWHHDGVGRCPACGSVNVRTKQLGAGEPDLDLSEPGPAPTERPKVWINVRAGCAAYGSTGEVDVELLDWDRADVGACPRCGQTDYVRHRIEGGPTGEYSHCEACAISWTGGTHGEIVED